MEGVPAMPGDLRTLIIGLDNEAAAALARLLLPEIDLGDLTLRASTHKGLEAML